ncbi:coiled-coil domain-containing protein 96 [Rhea pennata]|uniref:coiled-coil domain-containing protein 96 n=1 Tax=Rhea pennata TaxID=8795 RepID=UPI002E262957
MAASGGQRAAPPGEPAGPEEPRPEPPEEPPGTGEPQPEEPRPEPPGTGEPQPEEPRPEPPGTGEPRPEPPGEPRPEPPGEPAGPEEPRPAGAEDVGPEAAPVEPAGGSEEEEAEDEEDEDEAEDEEDPEERAALLEEQRGLASERERLRQASCRLQLRLGQLLRLRKGEEPRRAAAAGGEQRYAERLRELRALRERQREAAAGCQRRLSARRRGCGERRARAAAAWAALQAREREAAARALGRRGGGRAGRRKEEEVSEARVENIKLKHEIEKLEAVLKARGEGAEGVRFIDFEQLKKENQKYSDKIDDLSEELLKLQKKISNTVQILSQFKEKLQFVEAENQARKAELMDIEAILSQKRDILTKTKQTRDRLRLNNLELQQKCGLLGNETLLRDFEEKVDAAKFLSQRLEILKRHHAGLILTCKGIKKKIKEAKSFLPC